MLLWLGLQQKLEGRRIQNWKKNNVRDFATINELTVLSNLKSHNVQMTREGKEKEE